MQTQERQISSVSSACCGAAGQKARKSSSQSYSQSYSLSIFSISTLIDTSDRVPKRSPRWRFFSASFSAANPTTYLVSFFC